MDKHHQEPSSLATLQVAVGSLLKYETEKHIFHSLEMNKKQRQFSSQQDKTEKYESMTKKNEEWPYYVRSYQITLIIN